jgi:8-hydroxy-5-deazaflavin:NADPH oxidoreductase
MKVGIIGSGAVGRALGTGFADLGHEVKLGTRDINKEQLRTWLSKTGPQASVGSFSEAAGFGELIVLATSWSGTESALQLANKKNLTGKVVIDATNPLTSTAGGPPGLALGHTDSGGEQVQRWLTDAHVVKAFNIVGNPFMVNPQFPGGPPDMFICGNNAEAKQTVTEILTAFGWPTIDLGGIESSRYIEPLAMGGIIHGFRTNSWSHAFKLLRKQ